MKKKLTTVAVLGLVVACGFVQPAEAGFVDWFKDTGKSLFEKGKTALVKAAAGFAAEKICTTSSNSLIFNSHAAACAKAIHSNNHGTINMKTVTGGPTKILGATPAEAGQDDDAWMDDWGKFLDTPIGHDWGAKYKDDATKMPTDIADVWAVDSNE